MPKRARHKSIGKEMKPLMARLESNDRVTKVVLGLSENARHAFAPGTAKLMSVTKAGFRLKAYTGNGVMSIFVVLYAPEDLELVLDSIARFMPEPLEETQARMEKQGMKSWYKEVWRRQK